MSRREAVLRAVGVAKSLGGSPVLRGASLEVAEGEVLGLIGPNGSGKTTLVNVITGLWRPDSGRVTVDGLDVTHMPPEGIARLGVRRTFQVPRLFGRLTALQNAELPLIAEGAPDAYERAKEVLEALGFRDFDARPEELDLPRRRLVEVARAVAARPRLLVIDELLAGLSDDECEAYVSSLMELRRELGFSVLWVEHVVRWLFRAADRVAVMNEGSVVAEGSPEEVMASPEVSRIYFGA
ncbi:MAG: ATP-binding cassette domain-containing protein [Candidatus Caldarchaeales archaeon]